MKVMRFTAEEFSGAPFTSLYFDGTFKAAKGVFANLERVRSDDDAIEYCHSDAHGGCVVIILNGVETIIKTGEIVTIVRH